MARVLSVPGPWRHRWAWRGWGTADHLAVLPGHTITGTRRDGAGVTPSRRRRFEGRRASCRGPAGCPRACSAVRPPSGHRGCDLGFSSTAGIAAVGVSPCVTTSIRAISRCGVSASTSPAGLRPRGGSAHQRRVNGPNQTVQPGYRRPSASASAAWSSAVITRLPGRTLVPVSFRTPAFLIASQLIGTIRLWRPPQSQSTLVAIICRDHRDENLRRKHTGGKKCPPRWACPLSRGVDRGRRRRHVPLRPPWHGCRRKTIRASSRTLPGGLTRPSPGNGEPSPHRPHATFALRVSRWWGSPGSRRRARDRASVP
jgi:hypothetical protein